MTLLDAEVVRGSYWAAYNSLCYTTPFTRRWPTKRYMNMMLKLHTEIVIWLQTPRIHLPQFAIVLSLNRSASRSSRHTPRSALSIPYVLSNT